MREIADRFRKVAAALTERVEAVPADAWDRQSPCEDWKAREVIAHLAESARAMVGRAGVELPEGPPAAEDPVGAWTATRDGVQAVLEDPATAGLEIESPMGAMTLEDMIGRFGVGDVLVHTWDLARATGLDDRLDPDEVRRLLAVMEPNDEMMRQGTAFGEKVPVPDDADDQTRLIAFTGRRP